MPISDVLSAFLKCQDDPNAICDLFEETPLEKRTQLDSLVKSKYNITVSDLYYRTTKCVASLHFNFDSSIPSRFEDDVYEKILDDGLILDRDMTGYRHDDTIIQNPQIRTPCRESANVVTTMMDLSIHPENFAMECQNSTPLRGDVQIHANAAMIVEHGDVCYSSPTLIIPTGLVEEPQSSGECFSGYEDKEDLQSPPKKTTAPSSVTRRRVSTYTSIRRQNADDEDQTAFDIKYVACKRRKTDDIIIDEINHQGMIIFVTKNLDAALEIAKEHPGSHSMKLATLNFICPNQRPADAQRYAYWLYGQIQDGHLRLS